MNTEVLLGKTTEHLTPLQEGEFYLHKDMLGDFLRLKNMARTQGFELEIKSAFRSFEDQLRIWNQKATGKRTLLDQFENPLDFLKLSSEEIVMSILRWTAIPGSSRHHWGTDIDIFDAKAQDRDQVKLIPSETIGEGPSAKLHSWLDEVISQDKSFGFYRPYEKDLGGVSPERWHLSYVPLSEQFFANYTYSIFKKNIEDSAIELKEVLLNQSEKIFDQFFLNISFPI